MKNPFSKILSLGLLMSLALGVALPVQGQGSEKVEVLEWAFRVFLDDKEIGTHDFRIVQEGPSLTVESEASFDVKFLFFTAYQYHHRSVETWDQRGLASINSSTDANGKAYAVRGNRVNGDFLIRVNGVKASLPAEIMSFGYWNPEILQENRLLNSQTGEYESIEVIDRGSDTVSYEGASVPASHYDLMVKGKPISVWYAEADGQWLALESVAKGDRRIRYLPTKLPARSGEVVSLFKE